MPDLLFFRRCAVASFKVATIKLYQVITYIVILITGKYEELHVYLLKLLKVLLLLDTLQNTLINKYSTTVVSMLTESRLCETPVNL